MIDSSASFRFSAFARRLRDCLLGVDGRPKELRLRSSARTRFAFALAETCEAFLAATLLLGSNQIFRFGVPPVAGSTELLGFFAHLLKLKFGLLILYSLFERPINSIPFAAVLDWSSYRHLGLRTSNWAA